MNQKNFVKRRTVCYVKQPEEPLAFKKEKFMQEI